MTIQSFSLGFQSWNATQRDVGWPTVIGANLAIDDVRNLLQLLATTFEKGLEHVDDDISFRGYEIWACRADFEQLLALFRAIDSHLERAADVIVNTFPV